MCDYSYEKRVKLNVSIIPNSIWGDSPITSASEEELERIRNQGHTIINHTYNHLNFNELTKDEIYDEITNAENLMINNGYKKGSAFISVPSARLNTGSYEALIQTNAKTIFHKWGGYRGTNDYMVFCPYYPTTRMLNTSTLDSESTLAQMIL